jgi:cytochrome c5
MAVVLQLPCHGPCHRIQQRHKDRHGDWHAVCSLGPQTQPNPAEARHHEEPPDMKFSTLANAVLAFGIAAAALPALAADGKAVYDKTCAMCHAAGVANAPKFGDKQAWAPRAATGKDALLGSVLKGKGAMPPKAGNGELKDDDIKAAIDFMLSAAN